MADTPAAEKLDTEPKAEPKKDKKPRVPIRYVALVWDGDTFQPVLATAQTSDSRERPVFQEFEGFRRNEVLEELIDSGEVAEPEGEESKRKTPWVLIVPASHAKMIRGSVVQTRSVDIEDE